MSTSLESKVFEKVKAGLQLINLVVALLAFIGLLILVLGRIVRDFAHPSNDDVLLAWILSILGVYYIIATATMFSLKIYGWEEKKPKLVTIPLEGEHPELGKWQIVSFDSGVYWYHYRWENGGYNDLTLVEEKIVNQAKAILEAQKWEKDNFKKPDPLKGTDEEKSIIKRAMGHEPPIVETETAS